MPGRKEEREKEREGESERERETKTESEKTIDESKEEEGPTDKRMHEGRETGIDGNIKGGNGQGDSDANHCRIS